MYALVGPLKNKEFRDAGAHVGISNVSMFLDFMIELPQTFNGIMAAFALPTVPLSNAATE